ncbi:3-hydroxybutyrate dehydrogenase [Magnetospirillum gryphiswaldense]|uniref:D-beta-hydroxybutyrate dehydrogenase (BDH) (3-hydroxybutyrate dehydrogenase) (3-HBDH) n=2 Tax=Magnetospirillum gryphiswaldense TaxID=55518 RepID=V6F1F1_MAGGM|nr:3-hydroxybutyrate dehydrogenase [Magnetospirillum gryphiswaldense]AVM73833.1 D-beta-hydroxybutyrate dehydrogenase [Magnetospirillum gryphiswaldense MSR-1]AVM77736.1 D-beta-hydroxybutyrate dehydrogenase [Magnetospirillum gryphiswaldense]CAM74990.1 Dehydrogenases with different specificities (related to short-chain alcohol dehydrogenases) [Magnetospirillum gryphiswaldense MSR-1]CDK98131.1 D-beta-hydroxybutyrate dehydrogenase (BDH) (3-hydroxybutyrate dehydrogenase) (3-HBDH) [Magnetospirillum gr
MLKGRNAVVTGSTSGIGLGIARALAAQGCGIMLNGFGDGIEDLRAGLAQEFGVTVLYNGADLSKAEECASLIEDAEKRLGSVDILVNNAGIQHVDAVENFPVARWDAVIAINLSSAFHTIRTALPGMKARGWGRLINVASVHGLVASVNKAAYVAAKHGIIGLTKVVALENAENGITCNAICPGWVLTPLVQKQIDARAEAQGVSIADAGRDLLSEKQPSKRFTTPEELGELAVFLSSKAAGNMTGTSLTMDGGWTAQ